MEKLGKTIGIVAEFNPFHNGHAALVTAGKNAGYSHCVAVMSGNFTQRCRPAITEKRVRTEAALLSGVDLVLELPLPFATATAQHFAGGAVATLHATGVVDALCFGSEAGDTEIILEIVKVLKTTAFNQSLTLFLSEGITFAKARSLAIEKLLGKHAGEISAQPNNLLAVEYLRAAESLSWKPEILTIPRQGVSHHSRTPTDSFASASYLRGLGTDWQELEPYVPGSALTVYKGAHANGLYPASWEKMEVAVLSHLRRLSRSDMAKLPDISEGIENRFYSEIATATSLERLEQGIKTKRYPLSRIRRLIISSFLAIPKEFVAMAPLYIRILGFNPMGKELLAKMKTRSTLPFSTSLARLAGLGGLREQFAVLEAAATNQYTLALPTVKPTSYDYTSSGIFLT